MSMNLTYDYIDEHGKFICCDDFTFQTPTELTYKVLETSDKPTQIATIREYLTAKGWDDVDYYMEEIEETMQNPRVKLGMI